MNDFKTIFLEETGRVATLVLNRPEKHNAFFPEMIEEIIQAVNQVKNSPSEILILKGNGASFCAGADLRWFDGLRSAGAEIADREIGLLAEMLLAIYRLEIPTIAMAHGTVAGGGIGLLAACDFAIASPETKFGFREVRLGLVPAVISPFVFRKTKAASVLPRILDGSFFSATEAKESGLLTHLAENPDNAVLKLVGELFAGGSLARKSIKQLARQAEAGLITEESLEEAAQFLKQALKSNEAADRFDVILSK
jgi:methylglutaconyl-CoA hydratase